MSKPISHSTANRVASPVWWRTTQAMKPLEAIKITADHLEAGAVVPAAAASIIACAFRQYLAGQYDITKNLGLRPRRGGRHETPVAIARTEVRNTVIKKLVDLQDGRITNRCRAVADLLKTPPVESRVTEADVFRYLVELHQEFGGELPTSMRQVLRIVDGK